MQSQKTDALLTTEVKSKGSVVERRATVRAEVLSWKRRVAVTDLCEKEIPTNLISFKSTTDEWISA